MKQLLLLIFCVFTFSSVYSGSLKEYIHKYPVDSAKYYQRMKYRSLRILYDAMHPFPNVNIDSVANNFSLVWARITVPHKYKYLYWTKDYYFDRYSSFCYYYITKNNNREWKFSDSLKIIIDSSWFNSFEYKSYIQDREQNLHKEQKLYYKRLKRQENFNKIKIGMENFFNYWLFYVLYIIASLGIFQMQRYIRSGIRGSATPLIEVSMIVLNIVTIAALVVFGFKTVWYYPIILYALGWIVGEMMYLILRKLFGEWNPFVWLIIALISTIILYIVLFSPSRDYSLSKDECYICTGQYSKAYHIRKKCKGLKNCGGDVIQIKIEDLSDKYKNNPCAYCNKDK